jgi:hypothetical protein
MGIDPDDEETALWSRVMVTLLERGASPQEAIDGANLIVSAYRRMREEARPQGQPPGGKKREE